RLIEVCEGCDSDAEIPFDNILDRVTGSDPSVTDYLLREPVAITPQWRDPWRSRLVVRSACFTASVSWSTHNRQVSMWCQSSSVRQISFCAANCNLSPSICEFI